MKKEKRKGKFCANDRRQKETKRKRTRKWKILVMKAMTKKCISISKVAWQRRKIMANKGNRKEGEN